MSAIAALANPRAPLGFPLPPAPADDAATRSELEALRKTVAELNGTVLQHLRTLHAAQERDRINERLTRISQITPKDRRVVFIGSTGFAGNIKYAWLDFAQRAQALGIECWFAPQTREQDALMKTLGVNHFPVDWTTWTREHTSAALRTAVRVIDTHYTAIASPNPYQVALFSGAAEVQLWHGISIKEIALRANVGLAQMTLAHAQNLASCGDMSVFVGSSAQAEGEWRRWFAFDRYANVGYPRNDVLLREPTELDLLNVDTAALAACRTVRSRGGKVFFYTPTYRDSGNGSWLHPEALNEAARGLARHGHLLLVNLHPLEQRHQPRLEAQCPGVGFVAPGTDIYPLLTSTDALVTDYSSLMFDYLMTQRPVLLWRPDHDAYVADSRELFDEKVRAPLGATVTTADELVAACVLLAEEPAEFAANRDALRARLFDHPDSLAGERTSALIAAEVERVLA